MFQLYSAAAMPAMTITAARVHHARPGGEHRRFAPDSIWFRDATGVATAGQGASRFWADSSSRTGTLGSSPARASTDVRPPARRGGGGAHHRSEATLYRRW